MVDWDGLVLALSNLVFFLPFAEAVRRYRWTRAFVYLLTVFASGFYHACFAMLHVCLLDPTSHQHLDFFLSYLLVPLTALYFIDFTPKWSFVERWLILAFGVVIFVLRTQYSGHDQMIALYGITGVLVGAVVMYVGAQYERYRRVPPFRWRYLLGGLVCVIVSFVFFFWPEWLGYTASHSIWHVLAALGQYLILHGRDTPSEYRYATLDMRI